MSESCVCPFKSGVGHDHRNQRSRSPEYAADALAGERLGITVTRQQQASVRVLTPENNPLTDDDVLILYSVPEHQRLRLCSTTLQQLAALGPNRAATVSHLLVSGLAQLRNEPNPQETSRAQ